MFATFSSLSKAPYAVQGEGLSCVWWRIYRTYYTDRVTPPPTVGWVYQSSDPIMRGNVVDLAGGDGQVYDVDHKAGLGW
mgnify:CR=1 FL=1|jgi:hypothetical protein